MISHQFVNSFLILLIILLFLCYFHHYFWYFIFYFEWLSSIVFPAELWFDFVFVLCRFDKRKEVVSYDLLHQILEHRVEPLLYCFLGIFDFEQNVALNNLKSLSQRRKSANSYRSDMIALSTRCLWCFKPIVCGKQFDILLIHWPTLILQMSNQIIK